MLQAIRPQGSKPPFFMVHGLLGIMPIAGVMARFLDHDRPLYILVARGLDGAESPHERMDDMLDSYLAEIRAVRARGPYILGGVCAGGLIAMELARALSAGGEGVGSVVLVDPPLVPFPHPAFLNMDPKRDPRVYQTVYANVERTLLGFADRFSEAAVYMNDPVQRDRTVKVGIAMLEVFRRYVCPPFAGPTEFIVSAERAHSHFHPQSPWRSVVAKPRHVHVIAGSHLDIYGDRLTEVLRLVGSVLDSALDA